MVRDEAMATATEPQAEHEIHWLQAMGRVLIFPLDTFRRLYDRPAFLGAALVQTAAYVVAGLALIGPTERATLAALSAAHLPAGVPAATVAAERQMVPAIAYVDLLILVPLILWIRWTAVALVYYLLGLTAERETAFGRWYAVAVYAAIPGLLAYLLGAVLLQLGPVAPALAKDPAALFSAGAFLPTAALTTWTGMFLTQLNPFTFWYLALAGSGFAVFSGWSRLRSMLLVVGLWLLEVLVLSSLAVVGAALTHLGGA